MLDRVAHAMELHSQAMARQATVNYMDATPWFLANTLHWVWVMARETAALYIMHPHRSQEACAALIDTWAGILVRGGYGGLPHWCRPTPDVPGA